MLLLAHHDNRRSISRAVCNDLMQARDKGAGQVDDRASQRMQRLKHLRGDAMAADEHLPALRLFRLPDRRHAPIAKHVHHHRVVRKFAQRAARHAGISDVHRLFHRPADAHAEPRVGSNLNRHAIRILSKRISCKMLC